MTEEYTDIQIRIYPWDEVRKCYPVEATLDDGSFFDAGELRIDRKKLLAVQLDSESYGMELFDALFAGKIRRAYDKVTGRADAEAEGRVRVRLWIDNGAAELHAMPWERLYHIHKGQPVPLATSTLTPFSRLTGLEMAEPDPVKKRPVRMLVAIANPQELPAGLSPIDVEAEVENLRLALGDLRGKSLIQVTLMPGRSGLSAPLRARLENEGYQIRDGLTSEENLVRWLSGCHVLHFLGHGHFSRQGIGGEGTAALYLEEAERNWKGVKDSELVPKIANLDPQPHLVFLAACESAKRDPEVENPFVGLGPKLVKAGVPAVIAMQDVVPMEMARRLTANFYWRLLEHGFVDRALNEARLLLFNEKQVDWAIPVLFMRLKNGQLFSLKPSEPHKAFEPELVFVRAGRFLMGSDPAPGVPDYETPQHPVPMPDYYIGKYPVTNLEYAEFIRRVRTQDVPSQAGWFNRKPTKWLNHPVTGVSWHDALSYCTWLSKETGGRYRLPTEAEWEKAARGTDSRRYPWGEAWDDRCANVGSQETTPVGEHPFGASPFGCQDMLGNVEEWTRTLWGTQFTSPEYRYPYPFDKNDGRELATADDLPVQGKVVHRGGSYKSKAVELYCALRDFADPGIKITYRGFRVVMEV